MPSLEVEGARLHWHEAGGADDDVLLLVHGFPLDAGLWRHLLEESPAGWRAIAPDLRGFGGSGLGLAERHSMRRFARDLLALLDHVGAEHAVVCGLSMGGYVALALQELAPQRVRALVLSDTRATADDEEGRRRRALVASRARAEGVAGIADEMAPRLLAASTLADRPETVREVVQMMRRSSPEGVARASLGMAERDDHSGRLPGVACPVLVIVGDQDPVTPPEEARVLAGGFPAGGLSVVGPSGHLPPLESPEEFRRAVVRFLDAL